MTLNRHWLLALTTLLVIPVAAASARADDRSQRVDITTEEIRAALAASGVHVTLDQLESLSSVTATQRNPRLEVIAVQPLDGSAARARLRCENSSVCLPFYVVLHWQQPDDAKTLVNLWQQGKNPVATQPGDVMVHNGKLATMIFEGPHVRITQPVLCLQNGARGQQIRVSSQDRQRVFWARVIGPGIVTAASLN